MFTGDQLDALYASVKESMSEKRFRHTAAVADMAERLGELFMPDWCDALRAAGLLHDITKEYSVEKQLQIFDRFGIMVSKQDILTPKTLHARTAALVIGETYPEFAEPLVIEAVRYHTTGRAGMSMAERIVYFADYIDETRSFPDCVTLRTLFWEAKPQEMELEERLAHFRRLLVLSFDMTIKALVEDGGLISEDTFAARNDLILEGEG
ncbi:MAG: bis(5'-nucleosyl)-tetraphosphatase (symmetrical) YqeK [Clostridia bacterium]|nr:bis(5'-nucleosyl)-tetraphosphatase (symmetrical) YqeK [Clostridia bacterium]